MNAPKKVSVILFYDSQGNILLQDRRTRSKWGEEYGFFGGGGEDGEFPDETLRRELKEELGLETEFELFKRYDFTTQRGEIIERSVYLASMPDVSRLQCREGALAPRTFKDSFDLKMIPGFNELLREIYEYLKREHRTI